MTLILASKERVVLVVSRMRKDPISGETCFRLPPDNAIPRDRSLACLKMLWAFANHTLKIMED